MNNSRNLTFCYCNFYDIFFLINREKHNNTNKVLNKINIE